MFSQARAALRRAVVQGWPASHGLRLTFNPEAPPSMLVSFLTAVTKYVTKASWRRKSSLQLTFCESARIARKQWRLGHYWAIVYISFRVRNQAQDPSCGRSHSHLTQAFSSQFNHSGNSPHRQCLGDTLHTKNLTKLAVKMTAQLHQGFWFQC